MEAAAFKESAQDVLFVLKIDMGAGRHSFIDFGQTDTPEAAALHFCKTHGLSIKTYDFLVLTLQQKLQQVLGTAHHGPARTPKTIAGDFGFGAPVENLEFQVSQQTRSQHPKNESRAHKSSGRAVSGQKPPFTSATSSSERNLTAKWRSPQASAEQRQAESGKKQLEDKSLDNCELQPKGTLGSADVYERLYFHSKSKQLVDPLAESRSAASAQLRPRPRSSDSRSQSVSGAQASNRLYYCGLKNKSIRE